MSGNIALQKIAPLIHEIRGERVILDADLAAIYGVTTKRLNEQVKRNADRFPDDFAFQVTKEETANLTSQIATLKSPASSNLRSQNATSRSHGGLRYPPYAFTEHGGIMAANVLNSKQAVQMSVFVVRAFVKLREVLGAPAVYRWCYAYRIAKVDMPQSLSVVYIHLVFSTKARRRFLGDVEVRNALHSYIGGISKQLDCPPIQIGGTEDHVHVRSRFGRKSRKLSG